MLLAEYLLYYPEVRAKILTIVVCGFLFIHYTFNPLGHELDNAFENFALANAFVLSNFLDAEATAEVSIATLAFTFLA